MTYNPSFPNSPLGPKWLLDVAVDYVYPEFAESHRDFLTHMYGKFVEESDGLYAHPHFKAQFDAMIARIPEDTE